MYLVKDTLTFDDMRAHAPHTKLAEINIKRWPSWLIILENEDLDHKQ